MKCIYCGEEIKQKHKAGKERRICYKVECEKKYRAEMMRNYYHKKKLGLPLSKGKKGVSKNKKDETQKCNVISQAKKNNSGNMRVYREDEIVYVKSLLPVADELTIEVLGFAKEATELRAKGFSLVNKLGQLQSKNDTQDQEYLHWIESAQSLTAGEIVEHVLKEANNRSSRRDTKTLQKIVYDIIKSMPINPHDYAQRMIKGQAHADVTYAMKNENEKQGTNYGGVIKQGKEQ